MTDVLDGYVHRRVQEIRELRALLTEARGWICPDGWSAGLCGPGCSCLPCRIDRAVRAQRRLR